MNSPSFQETLKIANHFVYQFFVFLFVFIPVFCFEEGQNVLEIPVGSSKSPPLQTCHQTAQVFNDSIVWFQNVTATSDTSWGERFTRLNNQIIPLFSLIPSNGLTVSYPESNDAKDVTSHDRTFLIVLTAFCASVTFI